MYDSKRHIRFARRIEEELQKAGFGPAVMLRNSCYKAGFQVSKVLNYKYTYDLCVRFHDTTENYVKAAAGVPIFHKEQEWAEKYGEALGRVRGIVVENRGVSLTVRKVIHGT